MVEAPDLMPSGRAPEDIAFGNTSRIWQKIDQIDQRTANIAEDLAFIKGKLSEQKEEKRQTKTWHVAVISAIVGGLSGSLGLVLKSH